MAIPTTSYDSTAQKYADSIQWMNDLGVKLSSGRTSHYEKVVNYWKNAYKAASEDEARDIFPDFVSSMFEIHDFIDIYDAFKHVPANQLSSIVEKLQKGVNGPLKAVDETPKSTSARNFIFEVLVAARSHRPQNGVEAILDADSDTGIKFNDKKLWVECKRITTIEKIEANTRKASSQLEVVLQKKIGSGHRGIVAIDITKILNPGDKIYVQENDTELLASVDAIMDQFIKEYSQIWQKVYTRRHKKIIGTIIRFSFIASSEVRNLLVHAGQWGMNPRVGAEASDEAILRSLVTAID